MGSVRQTLIIKCVQLTKHRITEFNMDKADTDQLWNEVAACNPRFIRFFFSMSELFSFFLMLFMRVSIAFNIEATYSTLFLAYSTYGKTISCLIIVLNVTKCQEFC